MSRTQPFDRTDLVEHLHDLGVEHGDVLLVHSSFRAVRPVAGGPETVIYALLDAVGPSGTLVMPSMPDGEPDEVFDPKATPCRGMGIVADTFWRLPGVLRSDSPHSFAACGPKAAEVVAPHPPDFPHGPDSPVGRVHALNGKILLLGVDHDANTTLHLAEALAGVPYRIAKYCVVLQDGVPTRIEYGEIDHCCRNFVQVGEWLDRRGLQRKGRVGHAPARLMRSRDVVDTVVAELASDPCRFLCPRGTGCSECDMAWKSIG